MDEIYQKLSDFNPHRPKNDPNVLFLEITELWRQDATGDIKSYDEKKPIGEVSTWLDQETRERKHVGESLMMRLVWIDFNAEHFCLGLPTHTKDELVAKFQLEMAYDYLPSTITGVNAFPKSKKSGSEYETFAFCYLPKLAAIWSHHHPKSSPTRPPITCGLLLADEKQKKFLKKQLNSQWNTNLSQHPMFLAFLFSFMFDLECLKTVNDLKERIRNVEMETWSKRTDDSALTLKRAALGELEDFFIDMGNAASKLASVDRKSKSLEGLLDFIIQQVGEAKPKPAGSQQTLTAQDESTGDELIRHHVSVLRGRHGQQALDTQFTLKRVQVQMAASDSMSNFRIAVSSHRDASSMKTLAVVTMFFLPGSFISALFSTDCFDWDSVDKERWNSIGIPSTPQFVLYWAITIPLTLLIFILYWFWLQYQSWQRKSMLDELRQRIGKKDTGTLPGTEPSSNGKRSHTMTVTPRSTASEEKESTWIKMRKLIGKKEEPKPSD